MTLQQNIQNCSKCNLHKMLPLGCKPVPGVGNINAKLFIVGEALGADEVILGEPFVGLCGQFLTKCLHSAGITRKDCFISNLVKCRPTDNGRKNRPPKAPEVKACKDWLFKEIKEIKPSAILTLGNHPMRVLWFKNSMCINEIAGQEGFYRDDDFTCRLVSTFHPSYILNYSKGHTEMFIEHLRKARKLAYGF